LKLVKALLIYKQIQRNNTMNRLTSTLLAIALAASAGWAADPPGAEAPKKSEAELLYEKLFEANTKQADAAYVAYLKALEAANQKILAGLEAAKKDLNDPKKGKLSITERAKAIAEIDAKILEVKKSGVGEAIVAGRSGDLLGDRTKILQPRDITIVSAAFGNDTNRVSVAAAISNTINNKESIVVSFRSLGVPDPASRQKKNLIIKFSVNGVAMEKTFDEGAIINIDSFSN